MTPQKLVRGIISLVVIVLLLAACGGDDDKDEKLDPTKAQIKGVLVDASGEPIGEKQVLLLLSRRLDDGDVEFTFPQPNIDTHTNDAGAFTLNNIPPGTYSIMQLSNLGEFLVYQDEQGVVLLALVAGQVVDVGQISLSAP